MNAARAAVLADTSTQSAPPATSSVDDRQASRRRQRLQTLGMVLASYLVDTMMMLGLWAAGTVAIEVPLAYLAVALAACGGFYGVLSSGWTERLRDHYIVLPQMAVNAAINVAFIVWVPQIGTLLLMVLFIVFAFGALRMNMRGVVLGASAISLAVGGVIALLGPRLNLPLDTYAQRLLAGLWFALILVRSSLLGLYGSQLRHLLAQRNEQLAATFEKLEVLASRDELTGTLNRRSVMRLLEEERTRMQRTGQPFAIALLDIDHFKRINDACGHLVGDQVLRDFARRVAGEMRSTDRLGRYGGEEFLLLLTGPQEDDSGVQATERVRRSIAEAPWSAIDPLLAVTVSAGVTIARCDETATQLLGRADAALYAAKRDGRNCVRVG